MSRRFTLWAAACGALVSLLAPILVFKGLNDVAFPAALGPAIVATLMFGPPLLGAALIVIRSSPTRRGFGSGLIVGWGALMVLVFAVALLAPTL